MRFATGALFALGLTAVVTGCGRTTPATADMNDNRRPAGVLAKGVLTLRLEIRNVRWQPEGSGGITLTVPAFAEEGKAPEVPGPLVRVPAGTRLSVHIRNALAAGTAVVHGLHDRPGHADQTMPLKPGEERDATFAAGPSGTFFYWATTTGAATVGDRKGDGMLTGAFIVDPPAVASDDRVLVFGDWVDDDRNSQTPAAFAHNAYVINGRSWPATERLTYLVKQPIHWRVVNATTEDHPLHLHGSYFSVDSSGNESDSAALEGDARRRVVTHLLEAGRTMSMTWIAGEPGNWLFHCHILFHVDPLLRLTPAAHDGHDDHGDGGERHMAGLVLAVNVTPDAASSPVPVAAAPRRLTLEVGTRPGVRFKDPIAPKAFWPGLGYRWESSAPFVSPGAPLVINRGEPVEISIVNRLDQTTTVHWHGIELESYYDGVPGIGGSTDRRTPAIAPGKTFVVRFTPPRAGTFMYHTHLNDYQQLSTGLYGAIVVKEPNERFDPDADRVYVLSEGPEDRKDPVLINGEEWPAEQEMRKGKTYRLRFAGITPAPDVTVTIRSGAALQSWQPIAKDGMPIAGARPPVPASQAIQPGETYDFAFTPAASGPLRLVAALPRVHTEMTLNVK
jgi:FtsP/CotA-like multicopper oxidase with cupredoxin domain